MTKLDTVTSLVFICDSSLCSIILHEHLPDGGGEQTSNFGWQALVRADLSGLVVWPGIKHSVCSKSTSKTGTMHTLWKWGKKRGFFSFPNPEPCLPHQEESSERLLGVSQLKPALAGRGFDLITFSRCSEPRRSLSSLTKTPQVFRKLQFPHEGKLHYRRYKLLISL